MRLNRKAFLLSLAPSLVAVVGVLHASKPDSGDRQSNYRVCHNGRIIEVAGKRALLAHFRHGDCFPKDGLFCPNCD